MTVDPKLQFWFGVLTSILLGVGSNAVHLPAGISPDIASQITSWCSFLGWINTMVLTAGSGFSAPKAGPLVAAPTPTVVKVLLVAFVLSAFLVPSSAQAQTRKPALTGDLVKDIQTATGVKATGDPAFDLLKMLDAKLLPDLQYAQKLADANGNKLTSACWGAWIGVIQTNQSAVQTKNADGTTADLPVPDPHLITDLERAIDIRNALQPDSPFMVACSPVANLIKVDVLNFVGQVVGGGLSLTKLVPLL